MKIKKILLIDDDVTITDPLEEKFTDSEWEVSVLHDSAHAIAEMNSQQPDIILLDISMAGKSGIDILKELSETEPEWTKHIIMLTSMDGELYLAKAMDYGVSAYIQKAETSLEQILDTVNRKYEALQDESSKQ